MHIVYLICHYFNESKALNKTEKSRCSRIGRQSQYVSNSIWTDQPTAARRFNLYGIIAQGGFALAIHQIRSDKLTLTWILPCEIFFRLFSSLRMCGGLLSRIIGSEEASASVYRHRTVRMDPYTAPHIKHTQY